MKNEFKVENLSKLEIGTKTYTLKELCELFELNYSSKKQLDYSRRELDRYMKLENVYNKKTHKVGKKLIVTEIYEQAKPKIDGRGKSEGSRGNNTYNALEEILLFVLNNNISSFDETFNNIFKEQTYNEHKINIIPLFTDSKLLSYNEEDKNEKIEELGINKFDANDYPSILKDIVKEKFKIACVNLSGKKKDCINYENYWGGYDQRSEYSISQEYTEEIRKIRTNIINKEMKSCYKVVFNNAKLHKEFYEKLSDILWDDREKYDLKYKIISCFEYYNIKLKEDCECDCKIKTRKQYNEELIKFTKKLCDRAEKKYLTQKRNSLKKYYNKNIRKFTMSFDDYFEYKKDEILKDLHKIEEEILTFYYKEDEDSDEDSTELTIDDLEEFEMI